MIHNYVSIKLKEESPENSINITNSSTSITLGYPCLNQHKCTPYIIKVQSGYYLFECWGSIGEYWTNINNQIKSTPGYGGYASGMIHVHDRAKFYVYIGNVGFFNAVKDFEDKVNGILPGGATDVRFYSGDKWWDIQSLLSRIMVAACGGGSEWKASKGGNGGGIVGGSSVSATSSSTNSLFPDECPGAKQDSGSECPNYSTGDYTGHSATGMFGSGGIPEPTYPNGVPDYGGFGGGYYGWISYGHAYAGSGGSSFVSGHKSCNAVQNNTNKIEHTGNPYHYSGITFQHTKIISGENYMPLPYNNEYGFHSDKGAFRITLLYSIPSKCECRIRDIKIHHFSCIFILFKNNKQ